MQLPRGQSLCLGHCGAAQVEATAHARREGIVHLHLDWDELPIDSSRCVPGGPLVAFVPHPFPERMAANAELGGDIPSGQVEELFEVRDAIPIDTGTFGIPSRLKLRDCKQPGLVARTEVAPPTTIGYLNTKRHYWEWSS